VIEAITALAQSDPTASAGQPQVLVIAAGLLAFVLTLTVWRVVEFAITIAHEGSHAITASMTGSAVESVRINRSGGGATNFQDVGSLSKFLTWLAGYLGPSAFGLVGAVLLADNKVVAVLWTSLFFLLLALLQSGNPLGAVVIVATGAVIVLILRYAPPGLQTFFAYTWIWLLLIGGFLHVRVLQRARKQGSDEKSDAYQLRKLTHVPASLWSGFFWLATLVALFFGGLVLLELVHIELFRARSW
jgi:hypothetical protein